MNLDKLKPAWQRLRSLNSMQGIDREEILLLLEQTESVRVVRNYSSLIVTGIFIVLTFFFHGG